jgi:hypothetical protein
VSVLFAAAGLAAALHFGQTFWAVLAGVLMVRNLLGAAPGV